MHRIKPVSATVLLDGRGSLIITPSGIARGLTKFEFAAQSRVDLWVDIVMFFERAASFVPGFSDDVIDFRRLCRRVPPTLNRADFSGRTFEATVLFE